MKTFEELYYEVLFRALKDEKGDFLDRLERGKAELASLAQYDAHQLDCLLHPRAHQVVLKTGKCACSDGDRACEKACPFHAIHPGESGDIKIDEADCAGCELCIQECRAKSLTASRDVLPVLQAMRARSGPVYALVAPAFLGQLGDEVTPGKLRSALKAVGFDGMIEVSLLADILTLKEALEFDENVRREGDYQLTSCCCPIWIAMIRKIYRELVPHVPPAVSPMVAAGRMVKLLHPDAVTVFVGPCLAKKAEAREKDVADAVDFVLTFPEVADVFKIMGIDPARMDESEKDHSSRAGRTYAYSGGVSEAVAASLARINPDKDIAIRTQAASGVPACKAMIESLVAGKAEANFYEGMGCAGGCVGGPKALIPRERGRELVDAYGKAAPYQTPIDNPYVIELLHRLGFETVEGLLGKSDIFTRDFSL